MLVSTHTVHMNPHTPMMHTFFRVRLRKDIRSKKCIQWKTRVSEWSQNPFISISRVQRGIYFYYLFFSWSYESIFLLSSWSWWVTTTDSYLSGEWQEPRKPLSEWVSELVSEWMSKWVRAYNVNLWAWMLCQLTTSKWVSANNVNLWASILRSFRHLITSKWVIDWVLTM